MNKLIELLPVENHLKTLKCILLTLIHPFFRLAGKINWRFGRPYKCNHEKLEAVRDLIRPGMVILTHKDYELTNLFIKGYWTHSAMAVSEREIVEAVRQGVVSRRKEDFFRSADDFLILEPLFCSQEMTRRATQFARSAVGCSYNFFFSPREDSYYCTELICKAYHFGAEKAADGHLTDGYPGKFTPDRIIAPQIIADSPAFRKVI